jgi:deazaflavin-dependent oxidoreductase (nitroreductase family)
MDAVNNFNRQLIEEYRANGGTVTGMFAGAPLMLLTTMGARSGQPRTNPLAYSQDGDRLVVIAAKGGAPTHPDWYRNLLAHPEATVEKGSERFAVRASFPQGEERTSLYDQQAAQMPNFAGYQRNTTHQIPVIVLERVGS